MVFSCLHEEMRTYPPRWPILTYMRLSGVRLNEALNCGGESLDYFAAQLRQKLNRLKGEGFNVETGKVDYIGLKQSESFDTFVDATRGLRNFDISLLKEDALKKAFWINIYNALVIHGVIAYGARRSVREIRGAFDRMAYSINGMRVSADDIEHGILRANRGHILMPGPRFADDDPRCAWCLSQMDPRIHFALVCAADSCPPINLYEAEQIDAQLDLAARNFINNGGVVVDQARMTVSLSRIFQWYSADFGGAWLGLGGKEAVIRYVAQFLESEQDALFLNEQAPRLKVRYLRYNWALNM